MSQLVSPSTSTVVAHYDMGNSISISIINVGNGKFVVRASNKTSAKFSKPMTFNQARQTYTDFCKSNGRIYFHERF